MSRLLCFSHFVVSIFTICLALSSGAQGQNSQGPHPVPMPPPIPSPVDKPYAGTIALRVDLTNVNDRILNMHETIPVTPGEITLLYPAWLPGTHSPSNPVGNMAGLLLMANGKRISWVRDRVNMWAFHVDIPKGATSLEATFEYLA